ncbi:MAG TPA: GTP 3',8-cyclase MoaA [Puia sp.]|nr:GTP 3',8-cyclase MoaA [Puia sp.]
MPAITDTYGRTFRTLRVSLLQHCNLGCVYCVAGEEDLKQANASHGGGFLDVDSLLSIIRRLHGRLGLENIRLTGGEPLLYPWLPQLIKGIRAAGIPSVRLTTNGFLLERQAAELKEAGLEAVNVSLDAVDEAVFFEMSRRHSAARVVRGIDAAIQAGLEVKINSVVMKGLNDSQVLPLLEFAFSRGLRLRFLEVMAMGHLHKDAARYLVSQEEILHIVGGHYRIEPLARVASATARYWKTEEGHVFGVIANESEPFCRDCDRLRLDSQGRIYGCLSSNLPIGLDLREDAEAWDKKLSEALAQKQPLRFTGSDLSMLRIGG